MKHGKKYQDSIKLIEKQKLYDPREGIETVLSTAKAKFDETVEASIRLGVDPRHADQQVRGSASRYRQDRPRVGFRQGRQG